MRQAMIGCEVRGWLVILMSLLAGAAAWGEGGAAWVTVADVDSLELRLSLEDVFSQIDRHFQRAESALALRARKLEAMVAFYGWRAGRQEMELLGQVLKNLEAMHTLNVQKQEHAEIEDIEVLRSHNQVLEKRIALLQKQSACRGHLFRLIEIANLDMVSHESQEAGIAQGPGRAGE